MKTGYDPEKPFSEKILDRISTTWKEHVFVVSGYPVIKTPQGYFLEHCDGVGTKGLLHWENKTHTAAAQDAFAMNANDLAILGFQPNSLNCHLLLSEERENVILDVISRLAELCREYDVIYSGGETACLDTLSGMEIGVHLTGFCEKLINKPLKEGDAVFAHLSNGIHSNGLTLARRLLKNEIKDYIDELTKPTEIYLNTLYQTAPFAKRRMHITGGAFTKLRKIITNEQDITIDLNKIEIPSIFRYINKKLNKTMNNTSYEMLRTFNCGVGFIEVIDSQNTDKFVNISKNSLRIGEITTGNGNIRIMSPFDEKMIVY